ITVGHNLISRKIKALLRKGNCEHWHVDISGEGLDTVKKLSKVIPLTPTEFFENMNGAKASAESDYRETVLRWNSTTAKAARKFMTDASWSDLEAFNLIQPALPSGSDVQMGNSSAVRYLLLHDARPDLRYFGNRGVAGIDGCTSTSIGAAHVSGKLTTLISGDIAFFYDSNAFWNNLDKRNLRIIILNNGGGGIFRIIEGPLTAGEAFEPHFDATHRRTAETAAAMYDVRYKQAKDLSELNVGLQWLFEQEACAWLEVITPRMQNDIALKDYFSFIHKVFSKHG
ncbi:MAG: 2-succinyl-5-enolpyruvyl-6-hydroxy-3-cyclohexene-1-carboxylate synthase, partial [Flavobacteriales bacterium]